MSATLVALATIFSQLSLLAFGGGNTILPEMHRQVTEVHHWLTNADFAALFALAQAAPGPNMMVVPLIGWHVAGLAGMLVSTVAIFGPSSILTAVTLRLWRRFKDNPWRRAVQAGGEPQCVDGAGYPLARTAKRLGQRLDSAVIADEHMIEAAQRGKPVLVLRD